MAESEQQDGTVEVPVIVVRAAQALFEIDDNLAEPYRSFDPEEHEQLRAALAALPR